jgi:hypothetical protein
MFYDAYTNVKRYLAKAVPLRVSTCLSSQKNPPDCLL